MVMYRLKAGINQAEKLENYEYASEGNHTFSPQRILTANPEIIFSLPELELFNTKVILSFSEYKTVRGNIDILLIGSNGEIIIVETKLLRNPESTRQVVAQIIDYIKAFSTETLDDLVRKIKSHFPDIADKILNDANFAALLQDNIRTGNFKVIVAGDSIHPNVLGMIESIHSAPHLSFTIYLVYLHTCCLGPDEIIIRPSIVSSTVEIERSVIRIEIDHASIKYQVTAETPEVKGKGTKPILTWDQYILGISEPGFRRPIEMFRERWINEVDDSINMGQVGLSAGILYGGKRIPIQYIYNNRIFIISEKFSKLSEIPEHIYHDYIDQLKKSPLLYDKYMASGKVEIYFSAITLETLVLMLDSAINLAKSYKSLAE